MSQAYGQVNKSSAHMFCELPGPHPMAVYVESRLQVAAFQDWSFSILASRQRCLGIFAKKVFFPADCSISILKSHMARMACSGMHMSKLATLGT